MPPQKSATIYDLLTYRLMMLVEAPPDDKAKMAASAKAAALAAVNPQSLVDGMFAARAMETYKAIANCWKRAAEPDVYPLDAKRLMATAAKLTEETVRMVRLLEQRKMAAAAALAKRKG